MSFARFSADGKFEVSFKANVLVYENGLVMWIPCAIYKSSCGIDVKYFPFDEQSCDMTFGSWTYDGDEVDLTPYTPGFLKVRDSVSVHNQTKSFLHSPAMK